MRSLHAVCRLLVMGLLLAAAAPRLDAAETYKAGDSVEVFFLNKWWPATVVQTNPRGDVMAEFEFAATTKRQVFKATEVRFEFENGALARARTWSDPSGTFKVKAALLSLDGDNVVLRKPDKTELKVPLAKLSQADQDFVRRLRKELGPVVSIPTVGPAETFETSGAQDVWKSWGADAGARAAVEPDPLPAFVKLKQAGVAFPMEDFFDRLGSVLPLGGPNAWLLASTENFAPRGNKPGKLLWASLTKGKIEGQQALPPAEIVLDYHPQSKQLLTLSKSDPMTHAPTPLTLTVWKVAPSDSNVTLVVRWVSEGGGIGPRDNWGRIVDANTVLHEWKKNEYVAWDIATKRLRYRLTQESFFAPSPVLSGGRRYLILPEDRQVRVIETVSGALVTTLPAPNGASGAALDEDGKRLAVLDRNQITVWDLTSPTSEPEVYQAEAIGTPFAAAMEWVGSDRLLVDGRLKNKVLFSLKHRIALWNYEFDMDAVPQDAMRRVRHAVNGHLVYAATVIQGNFKGLAVGAVELPGPKVNELADSLRLEDLMIVKQGTELAVNIQCGEYNDRVYAALQQIAARNGWVLNQNAPLVIVCEMKRGEQQNVTYRSFQSGTTETVSFVPFLSLVRIMSGQRIAWQSGTATGAPPVVSLRGGQTAQGEVDQWQRPDPQFFERLEIPAQILDPDKQNGLGTTQVTNRGLIVAE
ncbi:MAG: SHD1 domain-containing protein [Pirellulales bacterium]